VPRAGGPGRGPGGAWSRLGHGVARRPRTLVAVSLVPLAVLGAGLSGAHLGLSHPDRFRTKAESIDGLATLSARFPAGASDPVTVITVPAQAGKVLSGVRTGPGVAGTCVAETGARHIRVEAVLRAQPDTAASYAAVRGLRERLHGTGALVGGTVATDLDTRDAAARDQKVVIPIVLAIVLAILIWLLRALVGPVLLVLTVVASMFGVLLDTLLVRTLMVPALVTILGRYFWWPGGLSRRGTAPGGPMRRRPHARRRSDE
jgi:RND superfamily putative drug exporter